MVVILYQKKDKEGDAHYTHRVLLVVFMDVLGIFRLFTLQKLIMCKLKTGLWMECLRDGMNEGGVPQWKKNKSLKKARTVNATSQKRSLQETTSKRYFLSELDDDV